jgi:hypothetical protein
VKTLYAADICDNQSVEASSGRLPSSKGVTPPQGRLSHAQTPHRSGEIESAGVKVRGGLTRGVVKTHAWVSHHCPYEFGSPKLPQTREAVILHSSDDLASKIQAIQNLPEKESGSKWIMFYRAYGRSFIGRSQIPLAASERASTGGMRT